MPGLSIPASTSSTILGIAALGGACAALLLHLITPAEAKGIAGQAVPIIISGLIAIALPQRVAPSTNGDTHV